MELLSERVLVAVGAGLSTALVVWLYLGSRARTRERLERAVGVPVVIPAARTDPTGYGAPRLLSSLGRRLPAVLDRMLAPGDARLAALPADLRLEWTYAGRGAALLMAVVVGALATTAGPQWLLGIAVIPVLVRVLIRRAVVTRASEARRAVDREVTSALDVFVLALEAGLPFDRAVTAYIETNDSPLARELLTVARELDVGYRRREALQRLVARTGSPSLGAVESAVRLAEDFGNPLAVALRSLATELRAQRRQRIQEAALRAPITMLLPTAGFILVPIFAIVLGPIFIRVLGGGGLY